MKRLPVLAALIILAASLVRIPGLFNEFWLDEIWSLKTISSAPTLISVFNIHHDNNHLLNSLFMHMVGTGNLAGWIKYRMLSLVLGIASLPVAYALCRQIFDEERPRLIALTLIGFSPPLVVYSSEARGYGGLIFFSLLSLHLLVDYTRDKSPFKLAALYASIVLGFLSHLTFVIVIAGLLGCYIHLSLRNGEGLKSILKGIIGIFALPGVIVLGIYIPFLSDLAIGGVPYHISTYEVINGFHAFALGYNKDSAVAPYICSIAALTWLCGVIWIVRGGHWFGTYAVGLLALPLVITSSKILTGKPEVLVWRYFLVLIPFLYMVLARISHALIKKGGPWKILSLTLLLVVLSANVVQDITFIDKGRGKYREALQYIYDNSGSSDIIVSSNNDFQATLYIWFYSRILDEGGRITYLPAEYLPDGGADWMLGISDEKEPQVLDSFKSGRTVYELGHSFPYDGGISGHHIYLYKKRIQGSG